MPGLPDWSDESTEIMVPSLYNILFNSSQYFGFNLEGLGYIVWDGINS